MLAIDKFLPLLSIMSLTAYFGLYLERRHKLFKSPGSALITLLIAGILGKVGVVPNQHIFYAQVFTWGIPLALASSLITSDPFKNRRLRSISAKGLALGVAVLIVVAAIGGFILHLRGVPSYPEASPAEKIDIFHTLITPKMLSQFPREGYSLFAVLSNALLPFTLILGSILPVLLRGNYPSMWANIPMDERGLHSLEEEDDIYLEEPGDSLENITILLSLSLLCLSIAEYISSQYPGIPFLLILALTALIVRGFAPRQRLKRSSTLLAGFIIHLLFFAAGTLLADDQFLKLAGPIISFAAGLLALEFLLILIMGRILKIDIETLTIISQTLSGGPYAAYAVAVTKRWHPLYWDALISGLIIYALLGVLRGVLS